VAQRQPPRSVIGTLRVGIGAVCVRASRRILLHIATVHSADNSDPLIQLLRVNCWTDA